MGVTLKGLDAGELLRVRQGVCSQNPAIRINQKRLKTRHRLCGFCLFTKLQYYEHTSPVKDWTDEQADRGCHLRTRLHK